jgi:hypothetical protein
MHDFIRKLLRRPRSVPKLEHMSEIGREVLELLQRPVAEWEVDEHTLDHKPTKLELWIANGPGYFRIYKLDKWDPTDASRQWFNDADTVILWLHVARVRNEIKHQPEIEALDRIRLARIKSEGGAA